MQIYRLVANSIRVSDFGRNSKPITWVIINVNVVGVAHVFGIEIVIIVVVAVIAVVMVVVVLVVVVVVVVVVAMAAIITAVIFDWKGKNQFSRKWEKMNEWMNERKVFLLSGCCRRNSGCDFEDHRPTFSLLNFFFFLFWIPNSIFLCSTDGTARIFPYHGAAGIQTHVSGAAPGPGTFWRTLYQLSHRATPSTQRSHLGEWHHIWSRRRTSGMALSFDLIIFNS